VEYRLTVKLDFHGLPNNWYHNFWFGSRNLPHHK